MPLPPFLLRNTWITARIAGALLLVLLCACAPSPSGEQTIRFWVMGREGEVIAQLIPGFERANPGIRVRVQQVPWTSAHEKLLTAWLKPGPAGTSPAARPRLVARLTAESDADKIAEELYLTTLTRLPDAEEKALCRDYLDRHKSRRTEAIGELAWALLTSAEFRLNH